MNLSPISAEMPHQFLPPGLSMRQFRSQDMDETRQHIGRMFCDHDMRLVDRNARIDTRTRRLDCGSVSIVEMSYGAKVMVQPGSLDHYYLVQIPLSGRARDTVSGRDYDCRPGLATVQNPDDSFEMVWDENCRKLVLRFDRARFERFAELQLGQVPRGGLRLSPSFEMDRPEGMVFASLLSGLHAGDIGSGPVIPSRMVGHWELCLMSALILMRQGDDGEGQPEASHAVQRVRDYLEAHAKDCIELSDLRDVAGVPLRTLHHQFRRSLGITPMQLLRDIRLERVRNELLRGRCGSSVTMVALDWGFDHLGRFSAAYKARFGESPRETLQRSRHH